MTASEGPDQTEQELAELVERMKREGVARRAHLDEMGREIRADTQAVLAAIKRFEGRAPRRDQ